MQIDRIIISRTDNIGDAVLALPMAGMLKEHFPSPTILFLGHSYTRAVIESCEKVDEFVDWGEVTGEDSDTHVAFLRQLHADAIIHLQPRRDIAVAARRAGIPMRIGTGHKGYHFWECNKRVWFSRRRSKQHEAISNLRLLRPLGIRNLPQLSELPSYYGLTNVHPLRQDLAALLARDRVNLIVHPKSKGSAEEWGLENFTQLICSLPEDKFKVFVTGTEEEEAAIGDRLPFHRPNVTSLLGKLTLSELIGFVFEADALVAASTGPLHLAAALGRHAIGLYCPRSLTHPRRWGPVGRHAHVLMFSDDCEKCQRGIDCDCIQNIPPSAVAELLEPLSERLPELIRQDPGPSRQSQRG